MPEREARQVARPLAAPESPATPECPRASVPVVRELVFPEFAVENGEPVA
ncbi:MULTISPECIES: hypothetical protein [Streptomyces]|nr:MULTISPECIES: hypothetical protein [Streptomyces]